MLELGLFNSNLQLFYHVNSTTISVFKYVSRFVSNELCRPDLWSMFSVARERCYKQIAAAVAKYRDIKKNINEGLNFYVTLQVNARLCFYCS